jgi:hypothetical protein
VSIEHIEVAEALPGTFEAVRGAGKEWGLHSAGCKRCSRVQEIVDRGGVTATEIHNQAHMCCDPGRVLLVDWVFQIKEAVALLGKKR